MSRKEWYEMVCDSMTAEEFEMMFATNYVDPLDFDYDFDKSVRWNFNLEYAYNEFITECEV